MNQEILIAIIFSIVFTVGCEGKQYVLGETSLYDDGQCRIIERGTAIKGAWKGDPTVRLLLNCDELHNLGDFELFSTRYSELYSLSVNENTGGNSKPLVTIEYCQYRSFESVETVQQRVAEFSRAHASALSIDIVVVENKNPCDSMQLD